MSQDSPESLIQRARNGGQAAFIELFVKHEQLIRSVIQGFVRNLGGVYGEDDLVHEVFLRAYQTITAFRGDEVAFQAFLRRTARGLCLNIISRHGKEPQILEEVEAHGRGGLERPDSIYLSAEIRKCVRKAIGLLPEKFKEVVVLKDIDGLGYEEIAVVLGVPVGTVKSALNRGRTQLKTLLRELRCVEML